MPGTPAPPTPSAPSASSASASSAGTGGSLLLVVIILIVAFAGAGLVVTLDHVQDDHDRPELTTRGDALVAPRLDAMRPGITALADAVDATADQGREVLSALRAFDPDRVLAVVAAGDQAVTAAGQAAGGLRSDADHLMDGVGSSRVSGLMRQRAASIGTALDAANGLSGAWQQVADASVIPVSVLRDLAEHDRAVIAATGAARGGDFAAALVRLGDGGTALARVKTVRDRASSLGRDTSTLDEWTLRAADYDGALAHLYQLLEGSGGVPTPASQAAVADVDAAQAALPPTNDALLIIVDEIGGQAVTQGLLAIEQVRGPIQRAAER